jgi:hypothetical protein
MIVWTTYFHLLIILPAFCIAAAVLLENISQVIRRRIITIASQKVLFSLSLLSSPFAITSAIGIFGLISSIMLITANHTLHNFVIFAFITQHLPDFKNTSNSDDTPSLPQHITITRRFQIEWMKLQEDLQRFIVIADEATQ